jgi:putative PIG3 family NAD(P)H quinone oxidoreductase
MKDLMQAVSIREPGKPEVLQLETVAVPELRESDVLVSVSAAGVNRPDVLQRLGMYPVPVDASPLPGLEIAGEIVAVGASVSRWQAGDKVMALTHGGGYAEFCRVDESHCLTMPKSMTWVKAAAVPETFFTVWYNVFMRAGLRSGESILVHGGSSGIGTTAIQLAKAINASVIVTAGTDEKCRFCEQLGADHAINYRTEDWENTVLELTGGSGVDVVLDMVAGPYMQKNIDVLGRDGRYVIIAFLQGPKAELNMRNVLGKRLTITGSTLRPQTTAEKAAIASEISEQVIPLLESGRVRPIIHATFPLADARLAHELMESSQHMGKIVLEI